MFRFFCEVKKSRKAYKCESQEEHHLWGNQGSFDCLIHKLLNDRFLNMTIIYE